MFSQYVEDITKNFSEGDANYKIVPSRFIALDVNYLNLDFDLLGKSESQDIDSDLLNSIIPRYFQNYFENGCAYGRGLDDFDWTPEKAKNLFWNSMWDAGFLTSSNDDDVKKINEIVYYGDINMHSYNEHKGMGYGEIYCYIPTDAGRVNCQVINTETTDRNSIVNPNNRLEGYDDINNLSKTYFYNQDFVMSFDSDRIGDLNREQVDKYNINTIVILYDIFIKLNDEWQIVYKNIPMGMYIAGKFVDNQLTNIITKFVSTSYGNGTSYGLRICTRFSVSPNGVILNTIDVTPDENYVNYCQLMTGMNENLSKMMDVVKSSHDTTNQYKDLLSIVKNNRTNVPYVRNVNGDDCWFVNGRFISKVGVDPNGCLELTPNEINDHINGIPVDNCVCDEISAEELAAKLGLTIVPEPEPENPPTDNESDFADSEKVEEYLVTDTMSIVPLHKNIAYKEDTIEIRVNTNNPDFTVSTTATWLTIDDEKTDLGNDNYLVKLHITENTDYNSDRTATVAITNGNVVKSFTVEQEQKYDSISILPKYLVFPATGDSKSITVNSTRDFTVTVDGDTPDWLTFTKNGIGNSNVYVTAYNNASTDIRECTLKFTCGEVEAEAFILQKPAEYKPDTPNDPNEPTPDTPTIETTKRIRTNLNQDILNLVKGQNSVVFEVYIDEYIGNVESVVGEVDMFNICNFTSSNENVISGTTSSTLTIIDEGICDLTISIDGLTHTIKVNVSEIKYLKFTEDETTVPATGGSLFIPIDTNLDAEDIVLYTNNFPDWISTSSNISTIDNRIGVVIAAIALNGDKEERSAEITIYGPHNIWDNIIIKQSGKEPVATDPIFSLSISNIGEILKNDENTDISTAYGLQNYPHFCGLTAENIIESDLDFSGLRYLIEGQVDYDNLTEYNKICIEGPYSEWLRVLNNYPLLKLGYTSNEDDSNNLLTHAAAIRKFNGGLDADYHGYLIDQINTYCLDPEIGIGDHIASITWPVNKIAEPEPDPEPIITFKLEVSAPVSSIVVGNSISCTAEYNTYDKNNNLIDTTDVTDSCTWSSDNTGVATVSNVGLVTGKELGSARITATYKGIMNHMASITINVFKAFDPIDPDIGDRVPEKDVTQICPVCGEEYDKGLAKCPKCKGLDLPSHDVVT